MNHISVAIRTIDYQIGHPKFKIQISIIRHIVHNSHNPFLFDVSSEQLQFALFIVENMQLLVIFDTNVLTFRIQNDLSLNIDFLGSLKVEF